MAWIVAGAFLPNGLPIGVVLYGLVLGGITSLTAMGLVILYRSARIINFAQAEIGGVAAALSVVMVVGAHFNYFLAFFIGLVASLLVGAAIDLGVIRGLFTAPRLIVTVATIGILQLLGVAEIEIPRTFGHLRALTFYTTPFTLRFTVGPIVFNGNHLVAMIVVPLVLAALGWFFGATDLGIAIRGAADSNDRALLLGIPVRRLSLITWVVASGLSGLSAMLAAPILGPQLGALAGPAALLAPLTAAVLARMESLTVAVIASLAIGVFEQAVFWSYPRSSTVDVGLFAVVLTGLLLQRRRVTRADAGDLGDYEAFREVRPIPAAIRKLPSVRLTWAVGYGLAIAGAVFVPLAFSDAKRTLFAYFLIYGILGISLNVLTGWAGQISLGQFAFAGVGAGTTASLLVHARFDLWVCLACAAVAGAVTAVIIGIPALRIPGLFLAVTTLAFAVPVSTYLLNAAYFPTFAPPALLRPILLKRFNLDSAGTFYEFCLLILVGCMLLARNYRRSRVGRVAVAVRDNQRGAASFAVDPVRSKLVAFAFSGGIAGVAGGLFVLGLRGIGFAGYDPVNSVVIFTMVVVGGMGSLLGGLLGAFYVQGALYFLHGAWQGVATGGGLLTVLRFFPAGLADRCYRLRDFLLRRFLGVDVREDRDSDVVVTPAPERAEGAGGAVAPPGGAVAPPDETVAQPDGLLPGGLLSCQDIEAAYGQVQVLFGVDLAVASGEVVALLGTNGAGKSTTLRVLSGLQPARRGRVIFDGRDITRVPPIERVKAGLVTVPGGRGVFPSLTVADNLRLAGWLSRRDPARQSEDLERVFALFPLLGQRLRTRASLLSGGEQQMLTLAQALMCRPRVLMIDELSLGLAPTVVGQLLEVVRSLAASGVTIVVVEQSVNVATTIASRAVFMERGAVRFVGATADLIERPDLLRSVFLGSGPPSARASARASASDSPTGEVDEHVAVEMQEITKSYGGVYALEDVSVQARQGEILGIIGANGAGKTTLFDVCSGFLTPDRGRILLGGADVTAMSANERADRGMGRVFQDARLFPSLTVAETLAVALERHVEVREPLACMLHLGSVIDSEEDVWQRVDELIGSLGLERYRESFIRELSTGTRRIVELGCSLAHGPSVLLLDEPSSGIAQRESEALRDLLIQLREQTGATFVIIEHDVPLVASVADRLVCLDLGQVICEGPPAEVLAHPAVVAAYLGSDEAVIARSGTRRKARTRTSRPTAPGSKTSSASHEVSTVR